MLHGWSGYRSGPHQMLTRAARAFSAQGHGVLRFDFGGRGDSQGDCATASLATMAGDVEAALGWCRANSYDSSGIVLLGLCSGCEVALAAATMPGVCGLALWSAPVFAAAASPRRTARKRADNLKTYARKLLQPNTYARLLRGRLDLHGIARALRASGGENRNREAPVAGPDATVKGTTAGNEGESGALPGGWREAALARFGRYRKPLLLVYGSADPTTPEALAWYRERYRGEAQVHCIVGANHSYYGLDWERQVIAHTAAWLLRLQE
jgi:pimeloyl-ACP methyl ester carboxylesterase